MQLGNFPLSLAVKDFAVSRDFYAKLGLEAIGANASRIWLILLSGPSATARSEGMRERIIATFTRRWNVNVQALKRLEGTRSRRSASSCKASSFNSKQTPKVKGSRAS